MNSCPSRTSDCGTCPGKVVCHCLQVTEEVVLEAVTTFGLRTVKEVRLHTGAGDGCTACHRTIRRFLDRHSDDEAEQAQSPSSSALPI
jgi:NifU-like protein